MNGGRRPCGRWWQWQRRPAKFLCCSYAHLLRSGSKSYATAALCRVAKESPMLDLLFLGGGFLLLCLLIAYARLISQI
jgi:hypothetical protein